MRPRRGRSRHSRFLHPPAEFAESEEEDALEISLHFQVGDEDRERVVQLGHEAIMRIKLAGVGAESALARVINPRRAAGFSQRTLVAGEYHAIFHETDRAQVIERIRAFIEERFAERSVAVSLRQADKSGHTWEEHKRLKLRGSPHFAALRAAVKIGARFCKGIGLGWKSGFDSGRSLDRDCLRALRIVSFERRGLGVVRRAGRRLSRAVI